MKKQNKWLNKIPGEYVPFIGIGVACVLFAILKLII